MKERLAGWLVCPVTKQALALRITEQAGDEIAAGELVSAAGRRYAISAGVPRMLPEELIDSGQKETRAAFSSKWERAPDFGHEEKSRTFYINWYLERYEWNSLEKLRTFLAGKRRILDAGTGNGRDTRLYAENSRAEVFGVDISTS
ncbi:MAG TPA: hypothetical protein VFV34_25345, partial [Blastocatellia bacterium]|nr:hypothetical protein [Blastocatellia bacterium]